MLLTVNAVIFDMDGTLTVPVLDFDAMRAEMGITDATPVLEAMARMDPPTRAAAEAVLARHEADATARCRLNPGAAELLALLARGRIPTALLTRNCRQSVEAFCRKFGVRFDAVHTREDGPTKPSPEPVLQLCRAMDVDPGGALVVGDYLFDIVSGRAAGCPTCLIVHGRRPPYADQADMVIESLEQLPGRIALAPPGGE